jgi:Tfp pilus assembly protein PilZ
MEKRAFKRLPVNVPARLFYGNMVYTGIVVNLSENGMFVCTKMNYPVGVLIMMAIKSGDDTLKLPIKIRRTVKPAKDLLCLENSGMGVEVLNPSREYKDFVSQTRASL